MKKGLLYYRIPVHSDDWHKMRTVGLTAEQAKAYNMPEYKGGIGASEIGTVLGLNHKYRPVSAELFHFKVGTEQPLFFDNINMLLGRELEALIKRFWECEDGTENGWIETFNKWQAAPTGDKDKHLIKRAQSINAIIINPDYPYLSCNLDYYAFKDTPCMIDNHSKYVAGEGIKSGFPVECKSIGQMAAKVWDDGIPPNYIAQINQQMLVTDTYYAEIPILELGDKRKFSVYREERNDELCEQIVTQAYTFWQRVLKARRYYDELADRESTGDYTKSDMLMGQIQSLEPEPDENEKWKEYLSERYTKEIDFAKGSQSEYTLLKRHRMLTELIKALDGMKTKMVNLVTLSISKKQTEKLIFADAKDYARYYKKQGGINYQLDNRIKAKPTEEQVKQEIDKLNLNY